MIDKDEFEYVEEVEPTHRVYQVGYVEELKKELRRYTDENRRLKEWIGNRSEYRSRAIKSGELLNRVIDEVEDPWFAEAYEGFNDRCMFCDSQEETDTTNYCGRIYWHKSTCLWFDIHVYTGRTVGGHHKQKTIK